MFVKKKIWRRIRPNEDITIDEIAKLMMEIQDKNPRLDVFFDGDECAICSIDLDEVERAEKSKKKVIQRTLLDSL